MATTATATKTQNSKDMVWYLGLGVHQRKHDTFRRPSQDLLEHVGLIGTTS